ncbi:uncharacterized protein LOC121373908 isoform X2 [Gigantopelta aegis]|uniref:uncharacterized protein LOC121373908 isoform X2 n=1 Tax=Gigantopelta aegis TaxID=1735272 RepID=UPI001B88D900|nr:uncharacterized protein LOC121373908 isoform X2 [Gigantopelta aegis]
MQCTVLLPTGIRLHVRGKAHAEWKITRAGERRTVKQEETYIDERKTIWGKEKCDTSGTIPILPRGNHKYPFQFKLPESNLPCSFESKIGTIRYYIRVTIDIPYASCPQGIKYFTIIGPHIDCMDDRYLTPVTAEKKRNRCCLCFGTGPLALKGTLERSAYCSGESVKLKVEVNNGTNEEVWVVCKMIQYVEYFINRGVLGLSKELRHTVMQIETPQIEPNTTMTFDDLQDQMQVPVMPPSLVEVCGLVQIYYALRVSLESENSGETLEIEMPVTIATVPFRIPSNSIPAIQYDVAADYVEGGMYTSSEFQLGQVYMGDDQDPETDKEILYKPVYICVPQEIHTPAHKSETGSKSDLSRTSQEKMFLSPSKENLYVSEAESIRLGSIYEFRPHQVDADGNPRAVSETSGWHQDGTSLCSGVLSSNGADQPGESQESQSIREEQIREKDVVLTKSSDVEDIPKQESISKSESVSQSQVSKETCKISVSSKESKDSAVCVQSEISQSTSELRKETKETVKTIVSSNKVEDSDSAICVQTHSTHSVRILVEQESKELKTSKVTNHEHVAVSPESSACTQDDARSLPVRKTASTELVANSADFVVPSNTEPAAKVTGVETVNTSVVSSGPGALVVEKEITERLTSV